MIWALCKVSQIKPELYHQSIRSFAHLNGLDFCLCLWTCCEFETLKFTEHIHVALKLELGSFNDVFLGLWNWFTFERHTNLSIFLLNFCSLILVFHMLFHTQLIVAWLELDPLASLLCNVDNWFLECYLSLTEYFNIGLLVLIRESFQLLFIQLVAFRLE